MNKLEKQMASALKAALADITETARITCGRYNRSTKQYEFTDAMWKSGEPGSFRTAQKIRRALSAARQPEVNNG
jgi:hypothetical protein